MVQETLFSRIDYLRTHEGWAQDVWQKGVAAGQQDATHMAVQNAWGTYGSVVNEEAMDMLRAQEKTNTPMPIGANWHAPDITIFEVYKMAYDTGYHYATVEFDKVNPKAAERLAIINAAHKINRDLEPEAFARWERKMALHMQGYDGPSMEAAAALGLAVLSGLAPTAALLKPTATPGAAPDPMVSTMRTPEWEEGRALGALEYEAGVPPADMDAYQRMNPYRTKKDPFRQQAWFDGYMSGLANKPLGTERRASEWAKMKSVAAKTSGSSVGATEPMSTTSKAVLGLAAVGAAAWAWLRWGQPRLQAARYKTQQTQRSAIASRGEAVLNKNDDVGAVICENNGQWYVEDMLNGWGPMSKKEAFRIANEEVLHFQEEPAQERSWKGKRNRVAWAQPDGSFVCLPAQDV